MSNPAYGVFKSNWMHVLSIRGIKMIDIGYLFSTASVIGYIVARILSKIFTFDEEKYKNKDGLVW